MIRRISLICFLLSSLLTCAAEGPDMQEWTSLTGQRIEARFKGLERSLAVLETADGRTLKIAFGQLTPDCRRRARMAWEPLRDPENARTWEHVEEERSTRITCSVQQPEPKALFYTKGSNEDTSTAKQLEGFHYDLFVPSGYNTQIDRWYPLMIIASAGGNATMGQMAERLKRDGWIVAMLVESRNDDPTWLNNFLAAHDDVVRRVRVAPGAKFGTGMSGGARVASSFPTVRPGFRGVILQAAGMVYGAPGDLYKEKLIRTYPIPIAVAMTVGDQDSNATEVHELRLARNRKAPLRIEFWKGGHDWCPKEVFDRAMDWMEEVTYLDAPRPAEDFCYFKSVGVEELGREAYTWFFWVTDRRACEAQSPYARYYHLSRLPRIAANGNLAEDPEVDARLKEAKTEMAAWERKKESVRDRAVEPEFEQFWKLYHAYERQIAEKTGDPFSRSFVRTPSRDELQAAQEALAAGERILKGFPGTPQAVFLEGFLAGLRLESSRWE